MLIGFSSAYAITRNGPYSFDNYSVTYEGDDYKVTYEGPYPGPLTDNNGTPIDDSYNGYTYPNSGNYLGTIVGGVSGGYDKNLLQSWIDALTTDYEIQSFAKWDGGDSGSQITVNTSGNDGGRSGQWQVNDSGSSGGLDMLSFYTVKGGQDIALYNVDPPAIQGTWNVENLSIAGDSGNPPKISHFSAAIESSPTPEPTTWLLFGLGLLGFLVFNRNKLPNLRT